MTNDRLHIHLIRLTAGTAETALNHPTPQTLAALRVNVRAMGVLLERLDGQGGNVLPLHKY